MYKIFEGFLFLIHVYCTETENCLNICQKYNGLTNADTPNTR